MTHLDLAPAALERKDRRTAGPGQGKGGRWSGLPAAMSWPRGPCTFRAEGEDGGGASTAIVSDPRAICQESVHYNSESFFIWPRLAGGAGGR